MTTILAPLDGTPAGEAVLPHLVTLSFGYRATVQLVLAAGVGLVPADGGQRAAPRPRAAVPAADGGAYLEGAAQWLRQRGVTTGWAQPAAPPAALRRMIEQLGVDLLALSTGGWARLGTTALGALAEEVVRIAACPIVLLRVDVARSVRSDPPGARPYRRMVVALDGSPAAELVLPRVEPLARAFAAQLLLVRATIPPSAASRQGSEPGEANGAGARGPLPDPVAEADAERYLAEATDRLQRGGLRAAPVTRVGPADAVILDCARTRRADLIAMATGRGPAPFGRLGLGTTSDAVVRHAPCPVLIVPRGRGGETL